MCTHTCTYYFSTKAAIQIGSNLAKKIFKKVFLFFGLFFLVSKFSSRLNGH